MGAPPGLEKVLPAPASQATVDRVVGALFTAGLPTSFCTFLEAGVSKSQAPAGSNTLRGYEAGLVMPCGLPYPWRSSERPPTSSRRRHRWLLELQRRRWINVSIAYLTWLSLGKPNGGKSATALSLPLTEDQRTLVADIEGKFLGTCRAGEPVPLLAGGIVGIHAALAGLMDNNYLGGGSHFVEPLTLTADTLSIPQRGADILMQTPVVPPEYSDIFALEHVFDKLPEDYPPKLPPMCLRVAEWGAVAARIWDARLLRAVDPSVVEVAAGVEVRAGLFGVAKKGDHRLRVIVDRRRRNALERPLRDVLHDYCRANNVTRGRQAYLLRLATLPHASQFAELFVTKGQTLSISTDDAKDFFYLLRWPQARIDETVVGLDLRASDLLAEGVDYEVDYLRQRGNGTIALALAAPAMGDQKASETAQIVHQHCLREAGCLRGDGWLTYGLPPPSGRVVEGVYSDDRVVLGICDASDDGTPLAGDPTRTATLERVAAGHAAYKRVGIQRKPEKSQYDVREAVVWGGEISSSRRDVRGAVDKLRQLAVITSYLALVGCCSTVIMRRLVGCWVHHLMFQRCAMCLLDSVYKWMHEPNVDITRWRRISNAVLEELIGLVALCPLFASSLDSLIAPRVLASDATLNMGAVVDAPLTVEESVWLWGRGQRRVGSVLLKNLFSEEPEDPLEVKGGVPDDDLLHAWIGSKQFTTLISYRFSSRRHINIQEAVALRTLVKRALKDPEMRGRRIPILLDSQVVHSVAIRGRSSSSALNRVLQMTLPYLLFTNSSLISFWVRSAHNPADDPTRHAKIREAGPTPPEVRAAIDGVADAWPWALHVHRSLSATRPLLFYDAFSGPNSPLGAAFGRLGWEVISRDILICPEDDLTDPSVLARELDWIRRHRPQGGALGPPCGTFSAFMRLCGWSTRTPDNPWGAGEHPKEVLGNACVRAALQIAAAFDEAGTLWAWENPQQSLQWRLPELQRLLSSGSRYTCVMDWCMYGRPWRKSTIWEGRWPFLPDLCRRCDRSHTHIVLEGQVKDDDGRWRSRTEIAAEYSRPWCDAVAAQLDAHCRRQGQD